MSKKDVSAIISGAGLVAGIWTDLVKAVRERGGTDEDIHRLATPAGKDVIAKMAELIVGRAPGKENPFLRLISGGEKLVLDPTDGSEILAEADDVFAYIDRDFKDWNADEPGEATGEIPVCVREMVKDATFAQMFGSLSSDMGELCLTQSQIKGFVKSQPQWLRRDGYATFFLFKSYGDFFVACVYVGSGGGLEVRVDRFESSYVWSASCRHRLVVPQLA